MPAVDSFVGDGLAPSPYKEALAEIERLRVQLAACGVAAMQNSRKSKRIAPDTYGWSDSCRVVYAAMDREIDLRERVYRAEAERDALRADAERLDWLANFLADVIIGDADPCLHFIAADGNDQRNSWPQVWRRAIDAARKEGEG